MRPYRIRSGCRFCTAGGQVQGEGDVIELDDDVADVHADKLEPAEPAPVEASQEGPL